jgi:organic hydroperoxide reductase OsmC/OhrA
VVVAPGKPDILGSSDPHFRGAPERWNPEELLLASICACHQLWYLHLCSDAA